MSVRYSSSFGRRFAFVRCKYCCEVQGWTQSLGRQGKLKSLQKIMPYYLAPDFSLIFLKHDFGSTQLFFGFWLAHVDPCFPICYSAFSRCFQLIFSLGHMKSKQLLNIVKGFESAWGFPGGSDSEESACNAGHAGSIPREDPLEKGMATPLLYSCLGNPIDRGATGLKRVGGDWATDICTWKCYLDLDGF